jgi:hypothetical protein
MPNRLGGTLSVQYQQMSAEERKDICERAGKELTELECYQFLRYERENQMREREFVHRSPDRRRIRDEI